MAFKAISPVSEFCFVCSMGSTKDKWKKELELCQFALFRKAVLDFPPGEVICDESPDFLVSIDENNSLGVELVEIRDNSENSRAGRLQKLVKKAQRKAEESNFPPLAVDIIFNSSVSFKPYERESLATKIVEEIRGEVTAVPTMPHSWMPKQDDLKQDVASFHIRESNRSIWMADPGGLVHENFAQRLQNTIDSKEEKYSEYREKCTRCWLLVYSDAENLERGGESFYELSKEMKEQEFKSSFERVYFMSGYQSTVTRLRVCPPSKKNRSPS
ncbi:MAG: hypothetical protein ACO1RA_21395 [Planctomycetaceae bacterium]